MKRISKKIFLLFTILCVMTSVFSGVTAMAGEMSVSAVYQQNTDRWKISGVAGNGAHKAVTLKIYKSEYQNLTPEVIAKKEGIVKLLYTSESGAFSDSINFGTFFSSGSYTVEVYSKGFDKAVTSFLYVNPDEAASIIEKINDATSISEIAAIIEVNCYQLGVDESEYALKADCINEIIFNRKPSEGYSAQSFLKEYNNALCVYDLKKDEYGLKALFEKHSETVSFDYENDIKIHGEAVETMLRERLKTANYNEITIDQAIKENLLVSRILCAERYTFIEEIIEGEIANGVYDLSDFNNVKNKENVFKNLYNNKNRIENYADIKNVFEKSAETALENEKAPASSGGGGGGGGGGSFGGASSKPGGIDITEVKVDPEEDVLKAEKFTDTKNHWADEYIDFMAERKIANGYPDGTFKPEGFVTRAEFVKFVAVAFNLTEKAANSNFEDVKESDWFYPYVVIASSNGVVTGFNGKFRPNDNISRQDAAVILGRLTNDAENTDVSVFNDEENVSQYALSSVKKLASMGIIRGVNNNFMPLKDITRAEAAAMIVRLLGE